jgi:alkylhydroperoxidase/carboxymuconolactone decarboxylase family protein YurZ
MTHHNLDQASSAGAAATTSEWAEAMVKVGSASVLDLKTKALCYLSALAAARLPSDVPFRAARARALGASREEVISAILVGLRATGHPSIEEPFPAPEVFDS